jgi:uncharacterized protein (TIGR02145 family)
MFHSNENMLGSGDDKTNLYSVRCVKDGSGSTETATAQTAETPEGDDGSVDFGKLTLKGDVYYLNNAPFTGTARKVLDDGDTQEKYEMKDGKFHGKFTGDYPNSSVTGYYKDGKKHGEWKASGYSEGTYFEIHNYKDGKKHGEWKYIKEVFGDEEGKPYKEMIGGEGEGKYQLYKTETWENDKLIKEWKKEDGDKFTDSRDGKTYKTVKIGTAVWMAENLNFAADGSKCYGEGGDVVDGFDEDGARINPTKLSNAEVQANCAKYGRLYDWETAKKACPAGYRLPSDDEWTALENAVGGKDIAGTKLKSAEGWNNNGNGTDDYGFAALPGGNGRSDGSFYYAGNYGYWWSATEDDADDAWRRYMNYYYDVGRDGNFKENLFSVRCVKD